MVGLDDLKVLLQPKSSYDSKCSQPLQHYPVHLEWLPVRQKPEEIMSAFNPLIGLWFLTLQTFLEEILESPTQSLTSLWVSEVEIQGRLPAHSFA